MIRVDDELYHELEQMKIRGETFTSVIRDLLKTREIVFELITELEKGTKYQDWKHQQFEYITQARAERAELESRKL